MPENTATGVSGVTVQAGSVHGSVTVSAPGWQPPAPHQLPPAPAQFTNRTAELDQLHRAQDDARLLVLVGIGGVGKSSVAVEWAHQVAHHYPDGQLHLSLGGGSDTPVPLGDLLGSALRGLGVAAEFVPHHASERATLYRSLTHGRRLLVLADDATTTDQIRPLIPTGTGSLLVATARVHLTPLIADGVRFVRIDPLPQAGTVELLRRLLPDSAPIAGLAPIAALCSGMPLAVCAVAGLLTLHPDQPTDTTLAMLTRSRSRRTGTAAEVSMHANLDATTQALPDQARAVYQRLGLHPRTTISAHAAAALTGEPVGQTRHHLYLLTAMSLLTPAGPDAWTMHDVVADHARALVQDLPDTDSAIDRLIDYYLLAAAGADRTLNRQRWRLADVFARADDYVLADRSDALAWFEAQAPTIRALARLGHDTGRHAQVWKIAEVCKAWCSINRPYEAWEEITGLGLASARTLNDHPAEAFVLLLQAALAMSTHRFPDAEALGSKALAIWRDLDFSQGIASSLEVVAVALTAQGRPLEALPLHDESIERHEALGKPRGTALQKRMKARSLEAAAHLDPAADYLHHARELSDQALDVLDNLSEPDPYQVVQVLIDRVRILLALGDRDEAAAVSADAVKRARASGHRFQSGMALRAMADVAAAREHRDEEIQHLERAHAIFAALHAPEALPVADRLTQLGVDVRRGFEGDVS